MYADEGRRERWTCRITVHGAEHTHTYVQLSLSNMADWDKIQPERKNTSTCAADGRYEHTQRKMKRKHNETKTHIKKVSLINNRG